MKMRLKHHGIPRGGDWKYFDPMSQKWILATRYDILIKRLHEMYRQNGWPIGLEFEQQVEKALCEKHPEECEPDSPKLRRRRKLTWGDLVRGTKVLLSYVLSGVPIVEPEEAERRAAICVTCPQNLDFDKPCGGVCAWLMALVRAVTKGRKTSVNDKLKACGICHCLLEGAVQIPLEHQCKGVTESMKSEFSEVGCWKTCV